MEASVAAGGAAGADTGQGAAEAPQGGADLGQLAEQLGALSAGQEEMRQFLQSQPWQAGEEPAAGEEPGEEPLDLSFLDMSDPDTFDPELVAQRLSSVIDEAAERRAQSLLSQHVDPLRQDVQEMRREAEIERLVNEIPEIADPETGQQVVSFARQIAEAHQRPELANEPWFWRMTYMAGRAAEAHNQEGADDPRAAHLEGGAGARPGGGQEVDLGEQIFGARRGGDVLNF